MKMNVVLWRNAPVTAIEIAGSKDIQLHSVAAMEIAHILLSVTAKKI